MTIRLFANKIFLTALLLLGVSTAKAQSCGFSCLGLSGVYAGYSVIEFQAENFNNFIASTLDLDNLQGEGPNFQRTEGYRFGTNIFRAQFDDYFVSAKAFYQLSKSEQQFSQLIGNVDRLDSYTLELNYWGLGIDFGIPVFSFLDLKLVEGGITFFDVDLVHKRTENSANISEVKYETTKVDMSYYVASGIIIHIIPNYVSLEGTASYNIFKIDQLEDEKGKGFPPSAGKGALIEGNKFSATVQLNVGIAF